MQQKGFIKIGVIVVLILNIMFGTSAYVSASVPWRFVYEGRLLDSTGSVPLTTAHTFRFSFWDTKALASGDIIAGLINVAAPNYGNWQEFQTVKPNFGGFFSFELGNVNSLPVIDYTKHLYLQVEVKPSGAPDTLYEVLDRAPEDPLSDRSPIGSVPYAMNADKIDNADVGLSSGDIVVLQGGDVWPISTIPSGTDEDYFVIDNNDSVIAGQIDLQFGGTLFKTLSWDIGNNYFNFNDDVNIQGDLTLTGTVDGVDVSNLDLTVVGHLDGGPSKHDATEIDVEATDGHYYSAGDLETVIDDLDEAINSVAGGSSNKTIILPSIYEGVTYKPDGTNNIGRLFFDNDLPNGRNHYVWTSTRSSGLQDYDIIIQIPVPSGFVNWNGASPWSFSYRSTNASNVQNKADIFIYDTAGNPVTLTGASTGLASTTWATTSLGYTGVPTFTPGQTFIVVVKMYAQNNEQMHLGEIALDFTGT